MVALGGSVTESTSTSPASGLAIAIGPALAAASRASSSASAPSSFETASWAPAPSSAQSWASSELFRSAMRGSTSSASTRSSSFGFTRSSTAATWSLSIVKSPRPNESATSSHAAHAGAPTSTSTYAGAAFESLRSALAIPRDGDVVSSSRKSATMSLSNGPSPQVPMLRSYRARGPRGTEQLEACDVETRRSRPSRWSSRRSCGR